MATRTHILSATTVAIKFKECKEKSNQRLKEGVEKFTVALEQDAKAIATRRSGLPKDWRNRVLK